ncbi:uncharacterized protein LOC123440956 [Hordeum vulgare subsp. vulgare]|uniref:Predicted protein n=1 Tax=Hordeum vulgare subsp. vulgare TaxID=112509 RepID=F2CVJ6_HORVV|nr:uncharacterized protein LOC123440956 [Hordeum vulgare subsp. vulgare]BAJ86867.1 predicted protein [Hordeum vulgare subsp. vulgare]BAJ91954.1 predicted protein [Hordeum vulgare subsp. vulgare]
MDRKVCISLVILALVLAGPMAGAVYSIDEAAMPTSLSMNLESGMAPELAVVDLELEVHRRVLAGGTLNVLDADRNRCIKTCHPDGQPYTPGCLKIYHCKGGT